MKNLFIASALLPDERALHGTLRSFARGLAAKPGKGQTDDSPDAPMRSVPPTEAGVADAECEGDRYPSEWFVG